MKLRIDNEYGYLLFEQHFPYGTRLEKAELDHIAQQRVYWVYDAIKTCIKLVNETKTPAVFFERYDEMIRRMEWMAAMEPHYRFQPPLPSVQLNTIKGDKPATINRFIDRYYSAAMQKVASLKTETAKQRTIAAFFTVMSDYYPKMGGENIQKIEVLKKRHSV